MASITLKGMINLPLTVITLTNPPASLRGDLSKWMQEIATGVYVGNFNARIREKIWARVIENIGKGEATLSYSCRNEIGYRFDTWQTNRSVIDCDGIPLVLLPQKAEGRTSDDALAPGFSTASKYHKAVRFSSSGKNKATSNQSYVVIDLETSGLDYRKHAIIEIAAIKVENNSCLEYSVLVDPELKLPDDIVQLTGIDDDLLQREGKPLCEVLKQFNTFVEDLPLVGYNVKFDIQFLQAALKKCDLPILNNKSIDVQKYVKKEKPLLSRYTLQSALLAYDLKETVKHRALDDARMTYQLATKVNGFRDQVK
ncbi:type I-E CRISPR-associated endoribonuclease Cas2e [Peptococcus simiae]|uniref:Type I-E CRISPR-associated endoribonuclease Cas2e n=1 Tax=Peptococcus simiae TaxID=1643805 RepID=A0ABW9GZ15_9FIRM